MFAKVSEVLSSESVLQLPASSCLSSDRSRRGTEVLEGQLEATAILTPLPQRVLGTQPTAVRA